MNFDQKPPIDPKSADRTDVHKKSIILLSPRQSYTFGSKAMESPTSDQNSSKKLDNHAFDIEHINLNSEQHQQLLTGKIHPSVEGAIKLTNILYWIIFVMIIVQLYLLFNAIIEYYKIEAEGKPATLAYLSDDILEILIVGSIFALITYGIGVLAVYDKSYIKLRVFDFFIGILIICQSGFLVTQCTHQDKLWYTFATCITINTLSMIIAIIFDKYLRGKMNYFLYIFLYFIRCRRK